MAASSMTEAHAAYGLHSNAKNPARQRSKVSNGRLLPMTDGRSATAKRFRDLYEYIGADLSGLDYISEAQRQLVRRASLLSAECERLEALWARGEAEFDLAMYVVMTNSLRRVLETLGLKRVPRPVNDGTNALVDYFAAPPKVAE